MCRAQKFECQIKNIKNWFSYKRKLVLKLKKTQGDNFCINSLFEKKTINKSKSVLQNEIKNDINEKIEEKMSYNQEETQHINIIQTNNLQFQSYLSMMSMFLQWKRRMNMVYILNNLNFNNNTYN